MSEGRKRRRNLSVVHFLTWKCVVAGIGAGMFAQNVENGLLVAQFSFCWCTCAALLPGSIVDPCWVIHFFGKRLGSGHQAGHLGLPDYGRNLSGLCTERVER